MPRSSSLVSPFEYLDYRKFLQDWFAAVKKTRASMSYRRFSERAGIKSWNFIMMVIKGKRNLTAETIKKVCVGLKLNKQESAFFTNLVHFTQATDPQKRDQYYKEMLSSQKYNQLKPMDSHQYEYCSTWYHAAVRELAISPDCQGDPEWITYRLGNKVSVKQVENSLALLQSMGFINKNKTGQWEQAHALVTTGAEVESLALYKYHRNMLDFTRKMVDRVDPARRDISAMTLGVAKGKVPELKKKIRKFREEIMQLVSQEESPEEVVQLNIYFYAVTEEG